MITIRRGVFETNSSSTHSIVIARENTKPYDRIDFKIGEYGWSRDVLESPDEKASYFYTSACDFLNRDVADDIMALLAPYGINCTFSKRAEFKPYGEHEYLDNGYVDHSEDSGEFVNALLNDASQLIDYLWNDESYVETGNDNDDYGVGEKKPRCEYIEYYKGN